MGLSGKLLLTKPPSLMTLLLVHKSRRCRNTQTRLSVSEISPAFKDTHQQQSLSSHTGAALPKIQAFLVGLVLFLTQTRDSAPQSPCICSGFHMAGRAALRFSLLRKTVEPTATDLSPSTLRRGQDSHSQEEVRAMRKKQD